MPPLIPAIPSPEFPPGASDVPSEIDRRDFLLLAGASLALSGLAGCDRPAKTLVPYVAAPDGLVPGVKQFYATAMPWQGYARGILVESHEGRPTKIEGNPRHSESGGATDAVTQASIRNLYDPERSRSPRKRGELANWDQFEAEWHEQLARLRGAQGEGWAILTEPTTSPTLHREVDRWLASFPNARWYQFSALPSYEQNGRQRDYRIDAADVILSVDSDFLVQHPAAIRYGRAFAARRRLNGGRERLNRLYQIETGRSVTGGMADVRLPLAPSRLPAVLAAIETGAESGLAPAELDFVRRLHRDLAAAGAASLCLAGPEQTEETHQWVAGMNHRAGADGKTFQAGPSVRSDADPRAGTGDELLRELQAGKIKTVCCLGVNPVYASPPAAGWGEAIARAAFSVHVGEYADETSTKSTWHVPESHYLETWGDLRGFDGSGVIQQPLIEPLHRSCSAIEALNFFSTGRFISGFDLVRASYSASDETWNGWLNTGVVAGVVSAAAERAEGVTSARRKTSVFASVTSSALSAAAATSVAPTSDSAVPSNRIDGSSSGTLQAFRSPTATGVANEVEVIIRPDSFLWDGRFAHNAWLQELPRPYTSLVWDNALWISPQFAQAHSLASNDVIRLSAPDGGVVEAPVLIVPGVANDCFMAEFGGGRLAPSGPGVGRGFNAFQLQSAGSQSGRWSARARWEKTGRTYPLVTTQHHFTMEGRDPVHVISLQELAHVRPDEPVAGSLYPAQPTPNRAWGMLIDLSSCLGCSACVVACQAENNIPSVGKEAVARGREMHWIRIDRYYGPDDRALSQPVPCMHCENAPCEAVCPVAATVHSTEGVNEMVYNRCVGTRYCSNNCPYKVRRFNFFDLKSPASSPLHLQENPSVTVRDRGVMEKCTYCVQRIDAGRIQAERENRPLRDGEIRTACQQACPAEAIVFGDLMDPSSAVSRRKTEKTHYALLAELNARPRTTYLAKVINP